MACSQSLAPKISDQHSEHLLPKLNLPPKKRNLLKTQACQDLFDPLGAQGADIFAQGRLLGAGDLGDHHHAGFAQIGFSGWQQQVAGFLCPFEIAGQGADHHRLDAAVVEEVILNHHMGVGHTRSAGLGIVELQPVEVSLLNRALGGHLLKPGPT